MPMLDGGIQLVVFDLGSQEYALPIANVVQVVRMVAITPMPEAPDVVEGVINLRGKVIPVVDTCRRFGLRHKPHPLNARLLIVQHDGQMMALIVDTVSEVLSLPVSSIEPPAGMGAHMEGLSAVGKVGDRLLLIPDLGKMILTSEGRGQQGQILAELGKMLISGGERIGARFWRKTMREM